LHHCHHHYHHHHYNHHHYNHHHHHIGLSALCKRTGGELMRSRDSKEAISLMRAFLHRVGSEQGIFHICTCIHIMYIRIYINTSNLYICKSV
jgi:hypothetical protein